MQYMLFGQQVITFNNVCLDRYWAKLAQHILILQETHKHVGFWGDPIYGRWTSLTAQSVKNLPAMQETWVQFLGWEDPLEKEMATHSSTLAWKISWTGEPGRLQSMGLKRVGHDWATSQEFKVKRFCFWTLAMITNVSGWLLKSSKLISLKNLYYIFCNSVCFVCFNWWNFK